MEDSLHWKVSRSSFEIGALDRLGIDNTRVLCSKS